MSKKLHVRVQGCVCVRACLCVCVHKGVRCGVMETIACIVCVCGGGLAGHAGITGNKEASESPG